MQFTEALVGSTTTVTLYAQWAPIRTTTLTYNLNYAGAAEISPVTIETPNERYAIAQEDPTREGYTFLGWTTDQPGIRARVKYGNQIQADTLVPENNILYAQWSPSLTVKKVVEGNMGDSNKEFTFMITSTDSSLSGSFGNLTFTGGSASFTLKDGESRTISGVPVGSTYTIAETSYLTAGYTTTVAINNETPQESSFASFGSTSPTTMTFTNEKEVLPPTGVHRDGMPFFIMTAIALCAGAWLIYRYFRSRKAKHLI